MVKKIVYSGLTLAFGFGFGVVANAAPTSWSNSTGSADSFSYSNGSNDNGLAGDPTVAGDGFLFTVNNFKSESSGGGSDMVSETIHVTLTPNSGLRISSINANLTGDYSNLSLIGNVNSGYSASLDAVKHTGGSHVSRSLTPDDFVGTSSGDISDGLTLNLPSSMTGAIDLTFNTEVHTGSDEASVATAELKLLQLGVSTMPNTTPPPAVPLPAAVATFPIGAAIAGWARKRMAK